MRINNKRQFYDMAKLGTVGNTPMCGGKMDRAHLISRAMNTGIKQKRKGKNDGNWDICKALSRRDP